MTSFVSIDKYFWFLCDFFTGTRRMANGIVASLKALYHLTCVGQLRQFVALFLSLTPRFSRQTA